MKDFSDLIGALQELNKHNLGQSDQPELQTMEELEAEYISFAKESKTLKYDWGNWLPSLRFRMRPMVPGETGTVLAETGVGKTTILHNIALSCKLKTILFEIELPGTLTFERFVALNEKKSGDLIERTYEEGRKVEWNKSALDHIFTCSRSKIDIESIEGIIRNGHKKIGCHPALILIDYIGLIGGKGISRYERMSYVAEEIKKIAKATKTIIIMACQVARKKDAKTGEIFLTDAKDSGSIENSSGVVIGAWRDGTEGENMKVKILKQTKGKACGYTVDCDFKGEFGLITESNRRFGL